MAIIVQVWLQQSAEAPTRAGFFQVIETKAATFEEFCSLVADDTLIVGSQLRTRRIDDTRAEITSRQPIAFRGSAVARCQPNTMLCIEAA